MTVDPGEQDFVLTVVHVLTLAGRGTVVVGPVESGDLRSGEEVEIWDDAQLVTSARARVELICSRQTDPLSIGLSLGKVDRDLLSPGQRVCRSAGVVAPEGQVPSTSAPSPRRAHRS